MTAACTSPAAPQQNGSQPNNTQSNNGSNDQQTVITWLQWWKTEAGEEPLNELVAAFEAKHPNIKVDVQDLPFAQVHDKIVILNSSGNTPDVISISSPWVTEFAISGITEPLDAYYDKMPDDFKENVAGPLWADWKGKHYSIGFFTGNMALFYNKKKLAEANIEPPTTWEEYVDASVKLSNPSQNIFAMTGNIGSEPPSTITYEVWPYILQAGGKILENGRPAFNTPEGVAGLEHFKSLLKTHNVATPGELSAGEKEKRSNFSSENTAFMYEGPWGIGIQRNANKDLDFGIIPMPKGKENGTVAGGTSVGITAKSKNKEAAWEFVSFLAGAEAQLIWAKATNNFPHNKAALQDPYIQNDPLLKVFADQFEWNPINPDLQMPQSNDLRKIFVTEVQQFLTDRKTAEQALNDAAAQWNEIYDKYN